jgi:UDP-N-acetylglucosamine 1-carboxyvinyltransferase
MSKYVIQGGKRLEGELYVDASKNAVLPIIAATILTGDTTVLYHCPNISDVDTMIEILRHLGCRVKRENTTLIIDTKNIDSYQVPEELVGKMRSSIIVLGALVGRLKQAKVSHPGGCPLGARPIDLHLKGLEKMGISIIEKDGFITCEATNLHGATIHLDFPSVGATENIMLAAVLAQGETTILNAAKEPEIIDMQNYINSCGGKITGAGTDKIVIKGVKKLGFTEYRPIPDRIITGTYLMAAAITRGEISLKDVEPKHLKAVTQKLKEIGCSIIEERESIYLKAPKRLEGTQLCTTPYPGYPTDLQAPMMSLLCLSSSKSIIVENIFEARFKHVLELRKMGAHIDIKDQEAIIYPCDALYGADVYAKDLRGGAALVLAGLCAKGQTVVYGTEHIKRGYYSMVMDLAKLGADLDEIK